MRNRLDELLMMIPASRDLDKLEAKVIRTTKDPIRRAAFRKMLRAIKRYREKPPPLHLRSNPGSNREPLA